MSRPLRLFSRGDRRFAVDGTPTDCVLLAVNGIYRGERPDVIIAGINHGQNMGDDVTYSGTVEAAIEGSILGIPSIAVSLVEVDNEYPHRTESFASAARFLRSFLEKMAELKLPQATFLNINFPDLGGAAYTKYQITRLGLRVFSDVVSEMTDPRGQPYYWISGKPTWTHVEGSDYSAVTAGCVSISPLRMNFDDGDTGARLGLGEAREL